MQASATPNVDVLRRKLRADRPPPENDAISPARAVRMALARAADQALGLALKVGSIRQNRLDLADVVDQIEESWSLFPLSHDDGAVGAICIDPSVAFALVEKQTMGQLRASSETDRALTRTDRALTQPLADLFLRLFDETLDNAPTAFWTQGYRCEDAAPTRHMLALGFDATEYRVFDIRVEFVGTERFGSLTLILPIKTRASSPAKTSKARSGESGQGAGSKATLKSAALLAEVELAAVLCRIKVPLSDLRALEPGKSFEIKRKSLQDARLEDGRGKTSIPVHVGQLHGARAVRLKGGAFAQTALPAPKNPPVPEVARKPRKRDVPPEPSANTEVLQTEDMQAQADAELDAMLSEEGAAPM